jgi:hypothetical protein
VRVVEQAATANWHRMEAPPPAELRERRKAALVAHTALTLADNECPHGALPGDGRVPRGCRCWADGSRAAALVDIGI